MPHVVRNDNPVRHRAGGFAPRVGETLRGVVAEGEVFGIVGARLRLDGAGGEDMCRDSSEPHFVVS